MRPKRSVRTGLISGIILGSIVSAWMWYLLNDRETEHLMTQQSPKYQAQVSLQKFSEATTRNDEMGQLYHLEAAVKFLAEASRLSTDDLTLTVQHQNAILQLARLRMERHQEEEARVLRKQVLDNVNSLLDANATDESIRELALAAFLDWGQTPNGDPTTIEMEGQKLSKKLLATFAVVTPLDRTRLAISELHFLTLKSMAKRSDIKTQLALIDIALRSLMEGLRAAMQPVIYAAQVQKFINAAKQIAKASGNVEVQAYFRELNLDWRRRRTALDPSDSMAKILLAEAIVDTLKAQKEFDENGVEEVVGLLKAAEKDPPDDKALRRLFFAKSAFASYLSKQQQTQEALENYESALEIARKFGQSHPKELVTALRNLAFLTKRANDKARSKVLFQEAFSTVDKCLVDGGCNSALWLKTYYRVLKSGGLEKDKTRKQQLIFRARELSRKLSPKAKQKMDRTLSALRKIGGI